MKSDEKLWEVCKEIYRELFMKANPSTDFNKLIESGESNEEEFFMKYYLNDVRQEKIIDNILSKHKLCEWEKRKIKVEVHLGCSPNTYEKTWEEHRKCD